MPTDTTFLKLKLYNSTTDGSALFATFRADQAGTSSTSNMNLIDTFASQTSGSITALQAKKALVSIPAVYVSENYYEANSITDITSYATNQVISLSLDTESNGTVTLNINSLGTKSLNKVDVNGSLVNLTGSDLKKNREYLFRYNGSVWVWINGSSADQISINGTTSDLVMISGCGVLIDSGLQTSGSKLLGSSLAVTSGLIVTSGSAGVAISDGLEFTSGSVKAKLGNGLTFDTGSMVVRAGTGLEFSSGSLILSDSGVTSGSYNQVEVDDYGRVISGSVVGAATDGWNADANTWTYSSVDNPTGVFTIAADATAYLSLGMRIRMTNGGNTIYGIITKLSYSAPNTTVTFLHEINPANNQALYLMANSAITAPHYSSSKVPFGFPAEPSKWSITLTDTTDRSQVPSSGTTVYNPGSLTVTCPIGVWIPRLGCMIQIGSAAASAAARYMTISVSTANNTINAAMAAGTAGADVKFSRLSIFAIFPQLTLAAKQAYYITYRDDGGSNSNLYLLNATQAMSLSFLCAYY